uniref:Uncharacterized protein n=1 Tax=Arundo donax TaxID=35708 RepID=A0A0A9DW23_ARUDO
MYSKLATASFYTVWEYNQWFISQLIFEVLGRNLRLR